MAGASALRSLPAWLAFPYALDPGSHALRLPDIIRIPYAYRLYALCIRINGTTGAATMRDDNTRPLPPPVTRDRFRRLGTSKRQRRGRKTRRRGTGRIANRVITLSNFRREKNF